MGLQRPLWAMLEGRGGGKIDEKISPGWCSLVTDAARRPGLNGQDPEDGFSTFSAAFSQLFRNCGAHAPQTPPAREARGGRLWEPWVREPRSCGKAVKKLRKNSKNVLWILTVWFSPRLITAPTTPLRIW